MHTFSQWTISQAPFLKTAKRRDDRLKNTLLPPGASLCLMEWSLEVSGFEWNDQQPHGTFKNQLRQQDHTWKSKLPVSMSAPTVIRLSLKAALLERPYASSKTQGNVRGNLGWGWVERKKNHKKLYKREATGLHPFPNDNLYPQVVLVYMDYCNYQLLNLNRQRQYNRDIIDF